MIYHALFWLLFLPNVGFGSDAVRSRSLTSFEMTENFGVSFRGLPEKSFSSQSSL